MNQGKASKKGNTECLQKDEERLPSDKRFELRIRPYLLLYVLCTRQVELVALLPMVIVPTKEQNTRVISLNIHLDVEVVMKGTNAMNSALLSGISCYGLATLLPEMNKS